VANVIQFKFYIRHVCRDTCCYDRTRVQRYLLLLSDTCAEIPVITIGHVCRDTCYYYRTRVHWLLTALFSDTMIYLEHVLYENIWYSDFLRTCIVWKHWPDTPEWITWTNTLHNSWCSYMCIQWTCIIYSVVITWQSNPPISRFNSLCNKFTSVWSMFVYNTIE